MKTFVVLEFLFVYFVKINDEGYVSLLSSLLSSSNMW